MLRPRVPCPWSQLATRPRCDIITPSVTASPHHHHIALGPEHNSLHELLSYHHSRWSSYRLYDTCEKFQLDLKFTESNISHLVESLHLRADPKQGLGDNLTLDSRSQSAKWREDVLSSGCGDLGSVSELQTGDPGTNQSHWHCDIVKWRGFYRHSVPGPVPCINIQLLKISISTKKIILHSKMKIYYLQK